MTIGPTHYEGWTCKGCANLKLQQTSCLQKQRVCIETGEIIGGLYLSRLDTPSTCPYIRSAIIERNVEEI
jgi:hypothetical protein